MALLCVWGGFVCVMCVMCVMCVCSVCVVCVHGCACKFVHIWMCLWICGCGVVVCVRVCVHVRLCVFKFHVHMERN